MVHARPLQGAVNFWCEALDDGDPPRDLVSLTPSDAT